MCNFCWWRRRDKPQPQLKQNPKKQSSKTLKAKVPTRKQSKVVASKVSTTIPSDENLLADLPSSSVQTIQIPGSGLQPVEDSNIFKWKQFKEKVESSVKRLKQKFSQQTSKKVTEGQPVNDSLEDEDGDQPNKHLSLRCFGCQRRRRSLLPRSKQSLHAKKGKNKKKTRVDSRDKNEKRKTKDKTSLMKPSSHSLKQPLSSFSSTPSIDDAKPKLKSPVVVHNENCPLITPTSAPLPSANSKGRDSARQKEMPMPKFVAGNDSESSSKSIGSTQSDYFSTTDSEKSTSLE